MHNSDDKEQKSVQPYNIDMIPLSRSVDEKEKSSPSDEESKTTPLSEDQESIQPYDIESIPLSRP